jgi:hypothetical protein
MVDLYYSSSETGDVPIALGIPDSGVYLWTVPSLAAASDYVIKIVQKNSAGQVEGSPAVSGTFSSSGTDNLILLNPSRDETVAPGANVRVAWQTVTAGTPVDVQLQVSGGSWTTLASSITEDWADVTLPNTTANQARIRIINHSTGLGDTQDGFFRIGSAAAMTSLGNLQIGTDQTLNWISPAGSDTVTVQYWNSAGWLPVATQMPDSGHMTWFVPEMFTNGAVVQISFYNASGTQIGTATSNSFNIDYTLTTGTEIPCYRLFNNGTKEHLYTTDAYEYSVLGSEGWNQEGAVFQVYNGPISISGINAEPNYRLYNPVTYQHLWTTDRNEYFTLRASGAWDAEGVADYVFGGPVAGSTPMYRLCYNGPTLLHLWTTDLNEYDTLPGFGWTQESIVGYVLG